MFSNKKCILIAIITCRWCICSLNQYYMKDWYGKHKMRISMCVICNCNMLFFAECNFLYNTYRCFKNKHILRTHAFLKIKSAYSCLVLGFFLLVVFFWFYFSLLNYVFILRDCECLTLRIKLGLVLIESCFPVKKPTRFFSKIMNFDFLW